MTRHSAQQVLRRIGALAKITDEPGRVTRTFCSPAMRRANDLVSSWMRAAGMETRVDAIGNLIGHYPGAQPDAKILLLGSHLDTVRNAGKFDGPLGVILAIACVGELHRRKIHLPFAIEIVGFADEEGVRYQSTYLGSKALAGCLTAKDLKRKDADGIAMADAIQHFGGDPAGLKSARLHPQKLLGYLEAHIEQGPVLQDKNLAVGVVTAIAGQARAQFVFNGCAGHAGTTPMNLREDALCAAAEFILTAENLARKTPGLVVTVGQIQVEPGASNVIPGAASLTLDLRHAKDAVRRAAWKRLQRLAAQIAARRGVKVTAQIVHEAASVDCSEKLSALLGQSVKRHQKALLQLPSGAGHDAAVIAKNAPVAMLFIRCKDGISHHPAESATRADIGVALAVMNDFLRQLARSS